MKRLRLSLSVKITAVLAAIIFFFVAIFSIVLIALTRASLYKQYTDTLRDSLDALETALRAAPAGDIPLSDDVLPYYILYKITRDDGTVMRTNDALIPTLTETTDRAVHFFVEDFFTDGNLNLLYMARQVPQLAESDSAVYHVQAAIDLYNDGDNSLIRRIPGIFLLSVLPLLVISVVVGYGVCTRMLKPIQRISSQAREISSGHLDRRFDENGAQDELTELARTFNELFERLEKDFERQKRFTSDAAHELKTPLAVMNGYVDMVRRWGKDDARVLDESLAVLKRELVSMTAFTENLLVLARTENAAHDFERRTFAVKPVLERVRDDCLLHAPAVCCDIICAEDATLVSNEDAVRQMLHIMVQNSIKYSPPPAHVTLSFDGAVIRVTDEGFGIPESAVPHLFDRFYRVDESRNRQQGGAGLGLSIAQALAEKLDIRLAVTSSVGHGTTIALEFK